MPKLLSKLGAVVTGLLAIVAVTVAVLGLAVTIPLGSSGFLGDKSFKVLIVRSGSMEPTIPVGSLIVTLKQKNYRVGEIVTFREKDSYVTHRIVGAFADRYWTKGDANAAPDGSPLPSPTAVGKVKWTLPYAGFAVNFARTPLGFSLLIVFPALLIIIQEILAIGRELEKEKSRKRRQEEKILDMRRVPSRFALEREMMKERAGMRRRVSQAVSMMLVALVAGIGGTKAYFSDVATSTNNVFTAGTFIAQTLVINELLYSTSCSSPSDRQWVELWNGTGSDVNLKNFKLKDSSGTIFTITSQDKIVQSGKFALISKSQGVWGSGCYGDEPSGTTLVTNLGGTFTLNSTSGFVELLDSANAVIDRVQYGGVGDPSAPTDRSIERKQVGFDTATGNGFSASDFQARFPITPGFALPSFQPVVLNEFQVLPNNAEFIEIYNSSGLTVDISGWKLTKGAGTSTVFTVPASTSLTAGSRLYVNLTASANDLPDSGDRIYLKDGVGVIRDAFSYGRVEPPTGQSWARIPDGSSNWILDPSPTPNAVNN